MDFRIHAQRADMGEAEIESVWREFHINRIPGHDMTYECRLAAAILTLRACARDNIARIGALPEAEIAAAPQMWAKLQDVVGALKFIAAERDQNPVVLPPCLSCRGPVDPKRFYAFHPDGSGRVMCYDCCQKACDKANAESERRASEGQR
jgi:hypothetical protein